MADIQALGPHIHSPARRNAFEFATAARRERQGSIRGFTQEEIEIRL
jgi:hypothetical protein